MLLAVSGDVAALEEGGDWMDGRGWREGTEKRGLSSGGGFGGWSSDALRSCGGRRFGKDGAVIEGKRRCCGGEPRLELRGRMRGSGVFVSGD